VAEIWKFWRIILSSGRPIKWILQCCRLMCIKPSKCDCLAIPFLGIRPEGIATVCTNNPVPKMEKEDGQVCLWLARGPVLQCRLIRPLKQPPSFPPPRSVQPVPLPRWHGLHSPPVPFHLPRPQYLPMQNFEQKKVGEARAAYAGKLAQFGVCNGIVSRTFCSLWAADTDPIGGPLGRGGCPCLVVQMWKKG
jgi:hypothetical protein